MTPQLSVIIPAHNEARVLPGLLADLKAQRLAPDQYEVIVVADQCTDATVTVARSHAARVIECHASNGSIAKNTGAASARGSQLLFIDADSRLPNRDFLKAFLGLKQEYPRHLIATCRYQPQEHNAAAHLIAWVKNILISHHIVRTANAGCLAITRSLFHTAGGFWAHVYPFELINLVRRARRQSGQFIFLDDTAVAVSMRRYERLGYLRTLAWWAVATLVYLSPHQSLRYPPASDLAPRKADANLPD